MHAKTTKFCNKTDNMDNEMECFTNPKPRCYTRWRSLAFDEFDYLSCTHLCRDEITSIEIIEAIEMLGAAVLDLNNNIPGAKAYWKRAFELRCAT